MLAGQGDLHPVRPGTDRVVYRIEDDRLVVFVVHVGDRKDVDGDL